LLCFGVVLCFDLGVVEEVGLDALVADDLEAVGVKGESVFVAGNVCDGYGEGVDGPVIGFGAAGEVR
jgi:hypothetical protein